MMRLINTEEDLKRYLSGQGTDHLGRRITDVLEKSDSWWEKGHDFIQWVFPTMEKSHFNWFVPTVKHPENYETPYMKAALERYRKFMMQANWRNKGDHNQRRITRILKCLRLFGYEEEAKNFFAYLEEEYANNSVQLEKAFQFWRQAME